MIIDEIKKLNIEAIKSRDSVARNILGVVMNKWMLLERQGSDKELTDSDMISIIQKTIKELSQEKENYEKVGNAEEVANITKQSEILEVFLPKMLSEEEIRNIINGLEDKSIPAVMGYFGANYKDTVDRSIVLKVLKGN